LLLLLPQPRRVLFNDVLIYKHTLLNQFLCKVIVWMDDVVFGCYFRSRAF